MTFSLVADTPLQYRLATMTFSFSLFLWFLSMFYFFCLIAALLLLGFFVLYLLLLP